MKEALVIFIILLLLLTIISVFGGSVRYSPDLLTSKQPAPTPSYPPFLMGEGFYASSAQNQKHATSSLHAPAAPAIAPVVAPVVPPASIDSPAVALDSIEPFQGAGEFAPF